jgi:outer membrane lipoprotein SlyB
MENRKIRGMAIAVIALATLTAGGCATVPGPYAYYPAPRAQSVEMGVVEGVRPLQFQGPDTGLGAVSGAALGGWAGSGIGSGSGNAAAIVGGVLLGSLIGNAVEHEASKRPGVELTVRLDAGRTIAVVQDATPAEAFRPGDRIRVVSDGYRTRIVY